MVELIKVFPQSVVVEGNKYKVSKIIDSAIQMRDTEVEYKCKTSGLSIQLRFQDSYFGQYSESMLRDKIEGMVTDTIKRQLKEVWG